jgi:glycosyltransferase involved in cell wall biosynthesis
MRGFWPDERVEGGIWSLKNPVYRIIYRYFKRMERILLTQADAIVTLTHSAAEQISDWNIPIRRPPMVIPCCVDTQAFPVVSRRSSISGSYLVYLGSLGTWYLLAEMMAFFKVYAAFVPGSKFLVLTRESPTLVIQEARRQGIAATSVEVRSATREEMPGLLSGVALSVFFVKPGFSKKGSSATKLGELLSSGIPVVSNHGIGDQDKFFEQHSIGALVQDFSEASYKAAITKILNTEYSQEALRQVAVELFDLEKGVVKYHTVYQAV